MHSKKKGNVISDPEGVAALNAIDEFENKNQKKPNRYPKASLENHLNLQDTMSKKIKQRTELTQNKMEQNLMKQYSQRRLAQGFKSIRMAQ